MDSDEQMLQTYRHDAHKVRGRSHSAGSRELAGVRVNLDVPYGADADASRLSRPNGKPETTVDNHETHYRLSLLTGGERYDPDSFALRRYESELHDLLAIDDAQRMHRRWLHTDLMSAFNEAVHFPYTSLKYHTLLVAALVDNYRSGNEFDELRLLVDDAGDIVSHRTVYSGDRLTADRLSRASVLCDRKRDSPRDRRSTDVRRTAATPCQPRDVHTVAVRPLSGGT